MARRIGLSLRVWWSQWSLDSMLAAGVDPASDPALVRRAAQLRSARRRSKLAAWIERLVRDSARAPELTAAVPLVRSQVMEARESLLFLAHLLRHAQRVQPRGVAMVQQMLTDGASVLYLESVPGAVERQVQRTIDGLVDERDATPEAWFSIANTNARELVGSDL